MVVGWTSSTLDVTTFPDLPPLTGVLDFSAGGSGTFAEPRYDVRLGVQDLFFGDEGIGEVTARLSIRDTLLTYELEAASPRLAVSGTGRIAMDDKRDADLSFRVSDTSLDPFVRVFKPDLSPYTTAVASGTVRVVGDLNNRDALRLSTSIERLDLRLVDYACAIKDRLSSWSMDRRCASTTCVWWATTPPSTSPATSISVGRRCRCRPTARRTWRCCRVSWATCAAPDALTCRH